MRNSDEVQDSTEVFRNFVLHRMKAIKSKSRMITIRIKSQKISPHPQSPSPRGEGDFYFRPCTQGVALGYYGVAPTGLGFFPIVILQTCRPYGALVEGERIWSAMIRRFFSPRKSNEGIGGRLELGSKFLFSGFRANFTIPSGLLV